MYENILIYPFTEEAMPIIRHLNVLNNLDIKFLVSPNGFGISNLKLHQLDGGERIIDNLSISVNFEEKVNECATVMFIPFNNPIQPMIEILKNKLEYSIDNNKDIIWALPEDLFDLTYYKKLCQKKGLTFTSFWESKVDISFENTALEDINVPIVCVFGEAENTNKFEIQMALREAFISNGYSVSQIGSRKYCEVLGFHSLPKFFSEDISSNNKILMFNRYVKKICTEENPDIIIIGVPGGIKPLSLAIDNDFGLTAFEISQAINIDFSILSVFNQKICKDDLETFKNTFRYRFNSSLDLINISNYIFDITKSYTSKELKTMNCDCKFYHKTIEAIGELKDEYYFGNVLTEGGMNNYCNYVIDCLANS